VFVTTSFWKGKQDAANYPEQHLTCISADDGKRLWDLRLEPGPWKLSDLRGGYTAPTPAADGESVYVVFGSAVIAAVDYDGKLLWRQEIVPHKFDVALGASPVLFGDWVLLQCDQVEQQGRLLAFDRKTGAIAWSRPRPDAGFTHSTPTLFRHAGSASLFAVTSKSLQKLDPMTGEPAWTVPVEGDTVSPIYDHGMIYVDSGRGGPGFAVDFNGQRKWTSKRLPEGIGSPVRSGELIYRLHTPGVLDCLRWSNGETVYSERVPGVNANASPIATADGLIYLATSGKSCVIRSGEKFEIVGTGDLGDPCAASPAVSGGRLYLKGQRSLYCLKTGP
jgi:outer membrane protein assembly factor BamB